MKIKPFNYNNFRYWEQKLQNAKTPEDVFGNDPPVGVIELNKILADFNSFQLSEAGRKLSGFNPPQNIIIFEKFETFLRWLKDKLLQPEGSIYSYCPQVSLEYRYALVFEVVLFEGKKRFKVLLNKRNDSLVSFINSVNAISFSSYWNQDNYEIIYADRTKGDFCSYIRVYGTHAAQECFMDCPLSAGKPNYTIDAIGLEVGDKLIVKSIHFGSMREFLCKGSYS